MKIIIATPILYEKTSPFNHLFKDIIESFLKEGHEIIRIVACENKNEVDYKMGIEDINIKYIPVLRKRASHGNIIQRYILDTFTSIKMAWIMRKYNADILFEDVCYSSYWPVRMAKKNRLKVVSMLQDVWPDNAVQSGLIKENSLIYRYFEMWQKKICKYSDKIICISDDMKKFISSKGVPQEKIKVIYNWGYDDKIVNILWKENRFVKKYSLEEEVFYAIYAGNIGRMQNIELIIKAAKKLKDNQKIHFLIIGDGAYKEKIKNLILEEELTNITLLPLQPSELATSIYSAAGMNIIPLVPEGTKTALPSKTGVCLSCGRPIVFCFGKNSMFYNFCKEYDSGECVSSSDENELVKVLLEYSNKDMGIINKGAINMYLKLFNRKENIKKYMEIVRNI